MLRKKVCIALLLLLILSLLIAGCSRDNNKGKPNDGGANVEEPKDAPKEEGPKEEPKEETIVWQAASGWVQGDIMRDVFDIFIEVLEEKTQGQLKVNVSGPETFPSPDQINLLRDGALDLVGTTPAFYLENLPEGVLLAYTWGTREQRREAGLYDIVDQAHRERYNAMFVTEAPAGTMHIFMRNPIKNSSELRGKRLRSPAAYMPALDALGATSQFMSDADTIDALQQGVIDGAISSVATYDSWNYYEVAPYTIYPSFAFVLSVIFANVDSVEALPEHLQKAFYDAIKEAEPKIEEYSVKEIKKFYDTLEEKGVKEIYFEGEDAQIYYDIFFDRYLEVAVRPNRGDEVANRIAEIHNKLDAPPEGRFIGPYNPAN